MTRKRKLMALGALLTMVISTTGCQKTSLLEGTLLHSSFLMEMDGHKRVVIQSNLGTNHRHEHYKDILSGSSYADEQYKEDCGYADFYYKKGEYIEDIAQFMTAKEVNAASKDELTDDMIAEIVYRAIKPEEVAAQEKEADVKQEETKENVKTKTLEQ